MIRGLQEHLRRIPQTKLHADGVYNTGTAKHAVCDGVNKNPADKVRQCGNCLYHLLEGFAFDLIQKDCEDHRKPGEE